MNTKPKTVVIKLGSSSILQAEPPHAPRIATLSALAETCVSLRNLGHRVVIVSSGAIAMGLHRMDLAAGKKRSIGEKQAMAAVGQCRLIGLWDQLFTMLHQPVAQILLTRNDIADRSRYHNATTTLHTLLSLGVIPIINENDTVSVSEILRMNKFGDNDTLSAIAAAMCSADYLFLLTDVPGLYTDNPRKVPGARRVSVVRDMDQARRLVSTATLGSSLGTGGMETKLIAAELAAAAGCATVITLGSHPEHIIDIVAGTSDVDNSPGLPGVEFAGVATAADSETPAAAAPSASSTSLPEHTLFLPKQQPLSTRRFWILHGLTPRGTVYIDEGAYRAISRSERHGGGGGNGGRLLPAGVVAVKGMFAAGQAVTVCVVRKRAGAAKSLPGHITDSPQISRPVSPDHYQHVYSAERNEANVAERTHTPEGTRTPDGAFEKLGHGHTPLEPGTNEYDPEQDDTVEVTVFGRGLTNYNSSEIAKLIGHRSSDIGRILGYSEAEHVVESIVEAQS